MSLKPSLNIAWVKAAVLEDVPSPAVVLGLDAIQENLRKMVDIAGGTDRLRPHVKTHKLGPLIARQLALVTGAILPPERQAKRQHARAKQRAPALLVCATLTLSTGAR